MKITLNDSELATVLVALRNLQADYTEDHCEMKGDWEEHFYDCEPLSLVEIDELCESINKTQHYERNR